MSKSEFEAWANEAEQLCDEALKEYQRLGVRFDVEEYREKINGK